MLLCAIHKGTAAGCCTAAWCGVERCIASHRIASHGHSIYAMAASLRWLLHSVSTRCAVQCSAVQCSNALNQSQV